MVVDRNHDVITFISKYLYFKNGVANFAGIIKIATVYIKDTLMHI